MTTRNVQVAVAGLLHRQLLLVSLDLKSQELQDGFGAMELEAS